jgi:hypothetical protein
MMLTLVSVLLGLFAGPYAKRTGERPFGLLDDDIDRAGLEGRSAR